MIAVVWLAGQAATGQEPCADGAAMGAPVTARWEGPHVVLENGGEVAVAGTVRFVGLFQEERAAWVMAVPWVDAASSVSLTVPVPDALRVSSDQEVVATSVLAEVDLVSADGGVSTLLLPARRALDDGAALVVVDDALAPNGLAASLVVEPSPEDTEFVVEYGGAP